MACAIYENINCLSMGNLKIRLMFGIKKNPWTYIGII